MTALGRVLCLSNFTTPHHFPPVMGTGWDCHLTKLHVRLCVDGLPCHPKHIHPSRARQQASQKGTPLAFPVLGSVSHTWTASSIPTFSSEAGSGNASAMNVLGEFDMLTLFLCALFHQLICQWNKSALKLAATPVHISTANNTPSLSKLFRRRTGKACLLTFFPLMVALLLLASFQMMKVDAGSLLCYCQ